MFQLYTGERVAVVGSTGYIGKAVVRESVRRGYLTRAVMRSHISNNTKLSVFIKEIRRNRNSAIPL